MSYQLKVIKDHPIMLLPLDESSGTSAMDISGCGNTGTYVGGLQSTTITNSLISQTFSFTTSINNISTTTFAYLSGVTSSIQNQINNISGVSLSANNNFIGSNTFANITFTGTLNNINTTGQY